MMDSLSLSRVTSNDDETDMLIPRGIYTRKRKKKKKSFNLKEMESLQLGMKMKLIALDYFTYVGKEFTDWTDNHLGCKMP